MATQVASTISVQRRLLEAGKHLFAVQGFENTTTSGIARDAGTSESQLMKYFGGKEGLLQRIFEEGWSRLNFVYAAAEVSTTPLDSLRVIFELLVKMLSEDRELRDLMLFEGRRIRGKSSEVLITNGYFRLHDEVTKLVETLLKNTALAGKVRPRAVTSALIGMLESMLRDQAIAERKTGTPTPASDEIRTMFQVFATCIFASPVPATVLKAKTKTRSSKS